MITAQQRQPPRLPPSLSKKPEKERRIQLQGTCNRVLKDLITIEGGSITTLGKGTIPFVLLMLMIEGGSGTTIDIFFRCFVDKKGMETKLKRRLHRLSIKIEGDGRSTSSTHINKKPDRSTLIAVTELLFDGRSRIFSGPKLTFIAKGQCCDMEPAIVEIYKNIGEKYSRLRYLEDAKEDNKTKWWI
ncbi:unnamed protein product [Brassica oleracea var. botrytis]